MGAGLPEAIAPAQVVGAPFLADEEREVGRLFHALAVRVAARMAGDLGGAVEERDGLSLATSVRGRRTRVCGIE